MPFVPLKNSDAELNIDLDGVEIRPTKGSSKAVGRFVSAEAKPSLMDRAFNIPSAAVRSFLRGQGYARGAENYQNEETFQDEALRNLNDFLNKTPVADIPESAQTLTRFLAGTPASAVGMAADIATNPADVLLALTGEPIARKAGSVVLRGNTLETLANSDVASLPRRLMRGADEAPGAFERLQAMRRTAAGQKKVAELLTPSGKEYTEAISARRVPGELKEGFNTIRQEVKGPKELVQLFDEEIGKVMGFRDKLIQTHNQPVPSKLIATQARVQLEKTYGKQLNQLKPEERAKVIRFFKDEMKVIGQQGELDTVKAQARKEFLQGETKSLLGKKSRGETVVIDPQEQVVKDAFRVALRREVERAHPDIAKLNARFDGLDSARDWSSKLQAEALNQPSELMKRLASLVRPSAGGTKSAAIRQLAEIGGSVKDQTRKIGRMNEEVSKLRSISKMKSRPLPDAGTIQYTPEEQLLLEPTDRYLQKLLPAEYLKQLSDRGGRQDIKMLPGGQGFELVDAEEAAGRIRLQKFRSEFQSEPDVSNKRSKMTFISPKERAAREAARKGGK